MSSIGACLVYALLCILYASAKEENITLIDAIDLALSSPQSTIPNNVSGVSLPMNSSDMERIKGYVWDEISMGLGERSDDSNAAERHGLKNGKVHVLTGMAAIDGASAKDAASKANDAASPKKDNTAHKLIADRTEGGAEREWVRFAVRIITVFVSAALLLLWAASKWCEYNGSRWRNARRSLARKSRNSSGELSAQHVELRNLSVAQMSGGSSFVPKIQDAPASFTSILDEEDVRNVLLDLPPRLACKDWRLLYASELHGYSLSTALRRYYGDGESFVASIRPNRRTYKWAGKNMDVVLSTESQIAFGGGGQFALWLDASFERGSSAPSPTFDNACLASDEHFKVVQVEIWGFATPGKSKASSKHKFKVPSTGAASPVRFTPTLV